MIKNKLISEIITEFNASPNRAEKIKVLRKYDDIRLRHFLQILHGNVKWAIKPPNYRPAPEPAGLNFTYLATEVQKLYRFVENHPDAINITEKRKKQLLVVILESLYKDEADILVRMMNGDFEYGDLNPKLIKEAYPDIKI
jgi:small-conductance mechanosensitive channel